MRKLFEIFRHTVIQLTVFLVFLIYFSMVWCAANFGNIGLSEIVFTLNMPLKGTASSYFYSYFVNAFLPTLTGFGLELILYFFPWKDQYYVRFSLGKKKLILSILPLRLNGIVWTVIILFWLAIIVNAADEKFNVYDFVYNQIQASEFIENEYVDAADVNVTFPDEKRNLICIYMESAESSFQDKENGGLLEVNIIPEMTELAKNNISFSQSEQIEGAAVAPQCGWTIAGLVAQTSGLPLKLFNFDDALDGTDNTMDKYVSFMPGATTLGDILEREGYHNFFMAGSDFTFGGRRDYFTQHGGYEIWDYLTAKEEGRIPMDYEETWGFEDEKLYEYAREKLLELAAQGEPFNFSMLTVDTHTGGGYQCELCPDIFETSYQNVWACASNQLDDFIEWIQQQDFYENTTICITGDHSSMEEGFLVEYDYDKHRGNIERKVYNVFINAVAEPLTMKNRRFTTMDYFPTILAAIGAEIEGDRLGLGTNLFSNKSTLAEEYGFEEMFDELNQKSNFYDNHILYPER